VNAPMNPDGTLSMNDPRPDRLPMTGHWPRFEQVLCGTQDDRQRLGLPRHYLAGRLEAEQARALAECRGWPVARLLEHLQSPDTPLAGRLAAGQVLAWLGDPRLVARAPDMVEVPVDPAGVDIGLPEAAVAEVLQRFEGLGLDAAWIAKECPRHRVKLAPYRLARYPVTHQEYREFLLDTGHPGLPSSWAFRQFPQAQANHPVWTVSADDADAYAAWLARCTGRAFRLPTEAEWEWAAAGPAGREFPWGQAFDPDRCNTAECGLLTSSPVGVFLSGASPLGLHDLAGNVEEYVADDYAPYPGGYAVDDHLARLHGRYRVARGGSFARFRDLARTRRRHGHNPRSAAYAMGFRLAETV